MSGKVVLLVEDNPKDEVLTLRALKKSNVDGVIIVVRDGAEALDYLFRKGKFKEREIEEIPRFILLDLKLPKLDGFSVLRKIRSDSRTKKLPVVIFTSSSEEKDLNNGYELGANSYICKPIDFEKFVETINLVGNYWLNLNLEPPNSN